MGPITVVSILVTVAALVWALGALRRGGLPLLMLTGMIALMLLRQVLAVVIELREHDAWSFAWDGDLAEAPALALALLAFVAVVLCDDWARRPTTAARGADSTPPQRRYAAMTAIAIGLGAIVASAVVGVVAYRASHDTLLGSIAEGNLALARSLTNGLEYEFSEGIADDETRAAAIASINDAWHRTDPAHEGSYLCVVDRSGHLILHTDRPEMEGRDVGGTELPSGGPPRTVRDLLTERSNWAGENLNARGEKQIAGYAYCTALDSLVVVHVPTRFLAGRVLSAILPWLIGLAIIAAILIPFALSLLHKSYCRAERAGAEATIALRESEERLTLALSGTDLGVWDWDITGGAVYVNEQWAAMLGYTMEEVEPLLTSWQLLHPDDRPEVMTAFEKHFQGLTPTYETEHRLRTKSGEWKWVHDRGKVVHRDASGKPLRVTGTNRDIDARRRAELDSAASRREFEMLADSSPSLVFRLDRDAACVYANRRWHDMTGLDANSWTGSGWLDAVHPEDRARVESVWSAGVRTRSGWNCEHRFRHDDGHAVWVLTLATPCLDEKGEVDGFIGTCTDISGLKRSEAALRESEERFRQLAEHICEVFWLTDWKTGAVLYASPTYETIFERTLESLYRDSRSWREAIHPEDRPGVERALESNYEDSSYDHEFRIVGADGTIRWIHERAFPIRDDAGQMYRVAGISEDITARKNVEAELRQRHRIERLLFSELDHRVRNNLSSLIALIDMTRRRAVDADAFAETVRSRVLAMATVHGLLTSSRRLTTSISDLVRALLPAGHDDQIGFDGAEIEVDARQATALAMVVHELIMNSTKYGALGADQGHIDIEWDVEAAEGDSSQVDLRWRERGGPIIEMKPTPGVGTALIEGLVRSDLRGDVTLGYAPAGVDHRFRLELESRAGQGASRGTRPTAPTT